MDPPMGLIPPGIEQARGQDTRPVPVSTILEGDYDASVEMDGHHDGVAFPDVRLNQLLGCDALRLEQRDPRIRVRLRLLRTSAPRVDVSDLIFRHVHLLT